MTQITRDSVKNDQLQPWMRGSRQAPVVHKSKSPAVAKQVVARVLHARGPLLSRPGHEASDGLIAQQLFQCREVLGERRGVVRAVNRAVAGSADGDGAVQHRVGVALFSVALVCAPVHEVLGVEGGGWGKVGLVREIYLALAVYVGNVAHTSTSRLLKLIKKKLTAAFLPLSCLHHCYVNCCCCSDCSWSLARTRTHALSHETTVQQQ